MLTRQSSDQMCVEETDVKVMGEQQEPSAEAVTRGKGEKVELEIAREFC